jgi:hypothetical protein
MEDYLKKLYALDPLFRMLVHSRLRDTGEFIDDNQPPDLSHLSEEDELEVLREYAVTLFREHRTLKNLFVENLQVTGKAVGIKDLNRSKRAR